MSGLDVLSSRVILRPADHERTVAFYRDALGLAIAREYPGGTVFFAGQSLIEVAGRRPTGTADRFAGALWLQVRDLVEARRLLTDARVPIVRDARLEPWGLREMWIADPDGVAIVLVEVPPDHPIRRDNRWDE